MGNGAIWRETKGRGEAGRENRREREMKEGKRDDGVRHHNPNVARCSCAGDR